MPTSKVDTIWFNLCINVLFVYELLRYVVGKTVEDCLPEYLRVRL